jgi:hypothetical protein
MSDEIRYLQVYKGGCYDKKYQKKYQKIIVFDLDETLGSFGDLYILWSGINNIHTFDKEKIQDAFNRIIDIYPEFLRYGILNILDFLYSKKASRECDKLFIYTNNICTPPWVSLIVEYVNVKLRIKVPLFDKIISAFKINNKIVEISRTQREKTCGDLIRCTLLPKTTEICFIDDTYHRDMVNDKVYYIQPHPYEHGVSTNSIIKRFSSSQFGADFIRNAHMEHTFEEYITDWFYFHKKGGESAHKNSETDVFVAQKMMYHIKEFFYLTNKKNRTRRKYGRLGRQTRKHRLPIVESEIAH